jgi:hypothetical protein
MTLSVASSNSLIDTSSLSPLAAIIAASLQMFAISAPEKPGVRAASFFEYCSLSNFSLVLIFLRWTLKISALSSRDGLFISTYLSNLPGLNKALSNMSALFVAASTITEESVEKPSISTSS